MARMAEAQAGAMAHWELGTLASTVERQMGEIASTLRASPTVSARLRRRIENAAVNLATVGLMAGALWAQSDEVSAEEQDA